MSLYKTCLIVGVCAGLVAAAQALAASKNGFSIDDALVPMREIRHGGPPRDGIPAIDTPAFHAVDEDTFLKDDDRVMGVALDGIAKAYPVPILDRHEIVNDWSGTTPLVVTYCPLCGSGVVFESEGRNFGVSGLLYNSDVLLYDRETESLWSQMMGRAISGPLKGRELKTVPAVHTTWAKWRSMHPATSVMSHRTGYAMNYRAPAYLGYAQSDRTMFPVSHRNKRYHAKEWVLGVELGPVAKAYPFQELAKTEGRVVDRVGSREVVVTFDAESATAWVATPSGEILNSVRAYWFAWFTFHPDTEIFVAED